MPGRQEAGRLGQVCTVILVEKPQSLETAQFECVQTVELAGASLVVLAGRATRVP
jgi:hypothetical protein